MNLRTRLLKTYFPKNAVGAEVGVHKGDFSEEILQTTLPTKLYLIDPWKSFEEETYNESWYGKRTPQEEMDKRFEKVVKRFKNFSAVQVVRRLSTQIDDIIEDNSLDFVYIDGDHTYEGVCADFDIFYKKVKPGGLITGDDYSDGGWWGRGVIDAVHLNLHTKNFKMLYFEKNQFGLVKG